MGKSYVILYIGNVYLLALVKAIATTNIAVLDMVKFILIIWAAIMYA